MTQGTRDAIADAETLRRIAAEISAARHDKWARLDSLTRANLIYPAIVAHAAFRAVPELRG